MDAAESFMEKRHPSEWTPQHRAGSILIGRNKNRNAGACVLQHPLRTGRQDFKGSDWSKLEKEVRRPGPGIRLNWDMGFVGGDGPGIV